MVIYGGGGDDLANLLGVLSKFNQGSGGGWSNGGWGKGGGGWGKGGGKGGWGKGSGKGGQTFSKLKTIDADRKVWVGGLPHGLTWQDLEKHFKTITGTKPSISEIAAKGTGVCGFKTAEDAAEAIAAVNGTELKGKAIVVDAWTKKEGGGGGGGGDGKWEFIEKIKDMQRSSPEAKAKWWAFTDEHHGGIHDPRKLDKAVLEEFLSQNPFEGEASLVGRIKTLQRSSPEAKEKWWAFTDEHHGGVHDPKKLDKAVLEEFLAAYA